MTLRKVFKKFEYARRPYHYGVVFYVAEEEKFFWQDDRDGHDRPYNMTLEDVLATDWLGIE